MIPAHPLALDSNREVRSRLAAGVEPLLYRCRRRAGSPSAFTRRSSRSAKQGCYRPVLELAAETASAWTKRPLVMVAGAIGRTEQAVAEAQHRARARLPCRAAFACCHERRERGRIDRALRGGGSRNAADRLLSATGRRRHRACRVRSGHALPRSTTSSPSRSRRSTATPRSMSPFGVVAAGAEDRVTLYTGNDDHIVSDLVTPFAVRTQGRESIVRFKGGLLGHWSVWVKSAVTLLQRLQAAVRAGPIPAEIWRSIASSRTATASCSTCRIISRAALRAATKFCAGRG